MQEFKGGLNVGQLNKFVEKLGLQDLYFDEACGYWVAFDVIDNQKFPITITPELYNEALLEGDLE